MKVFDLSYKVIVIVVLLYVAYEIKCLNNTLVQYFEPIMPEMPEWSEEQQQNH